MQWIHVKDEVPEIGLDVLVWNGSCNECQITQRLDEIYPNSPTHNNRYVWKGQGIINQIEFWMPLPNQPDSSKREDSSKDEMRYSEH